MADAERTIRNELDKQYDKLFKMYEAESKSVATSEQTNGEFLGANKELKKQKSYTMSILNKMSMK